MAVTHQANCAHCQKFDKVRTTTLHTVIHDDTLGEDIAICSICGMSDLAATTLMMESV